MISHQHLMQLEHYAYTFPTAASPRRTSLTLLLGLGAAVPAESLICEGEAGRFALRLRPSPYSDSLKSLSDGSDVVAVSDKLQLTVCATCVGAP